MTESQFFTLCESRSAEEFRSAAHGLEVAGPSKTDCFLVRESCGKTWLFSNYRKHGRMHTPSVWSELNVERIEKRND